MWPHFPIKGPCMNRKSIKQWKLIYLWLFDCSFVAPLNSCWCSTLAQCGFRTITFSASTFLTTSWCSLRLRWRPLHCHFSALTDSETKYILFIWLILYTHTVRAVGSCGAASGDQLQLFFASASGQGSDWSVNPNIHVSDEGRNLKQATETHTNVTQKGPGTTGTRNLGPFAVRRPLAPCTLHHPLAETPL